MKRSRIGEINPKCMLQIRVLIYFLLRKQEMHKQFAELLYIADRPCRHRQTLQHAEPCQGLHQRLLKHTNLTTTATATATATTTTTTTTTITTTTIHPSISILISITVLHVDIFVTHSALPARPQPLVSSQLVEV